MPSWPYCFLLHNLGEDHSRSVFPPFLDVLPAPRVLPYLPLSTTIVSLVPPKSGPVRPKPLPTDDNRQTATQTHPPQNLRPPPPKTTPQSRATQTNLHNNTTPWFRTRPRFGQNPKPVLQSRPQQVLPPNLRPRPQPQPQPKTKPQIVIAKPSFEQKITPRQQPQTKTQPQPRAKPETVKSHPQNLFPRRQPQTTTHTRRPRVNPGLQVPTGNEPFPSVM